MRFVHRINYIEQIRHFSLQFVFVQEYTILRYIESARLITWTSIYVVRVSSGTTRSGWERVSSICYWKFYINFSIFEESFWWPSSHIGDSFWNISFHTFRNLVELNVKNLLYMPKELSRAYINIWRSVNDFESRMNL